MMTASHKSVVGKYENIHSQLAELADLQGKSRDLSTKIWQKVNQEREAYNTVLTEYKVQRGAFNQKKNALLDAFNPTRLDIVCAKSLQALNDSWTTPGLTRGMRELIKLIGDDFANVKLAGDDIIHLMQEVYSTFHARFGFVAMDFPVLDFEGPNAKLSILIHETEQFCKDPINIVMTEKRFMVRRFWRQLVEQSRLIFNEARANTERWITAVPLPLETQIRDHKAQLEARVASLQKIAERGTGINEEVAKLNAQLVDVQKQITLITGLIRKVRDVGPAAETRALAAAQPMIPKPQAEYLETVRTTSDAHSQTQKIDAIAKHMETTKIDLSKL